VRPAPPPVPAGRRPFLRRDSAEVAAKLAALSQEDRRELARRFLASPDIAAFFELRDHPEPWVDEGGGQRPAATAEEQALQCVEDNAEAVAMNPLCNPATVEEWWDELRHLVFGKQRRPEYVPHAACWGVSPEYRAGPI
jgi:hypothetical protein